MASAFIANRQGGNDAGWDRAGVARAQLSAAKLLALAEQDQGDGKQVDRHPGYMDKFRVMMGSTSPPVPPGRDEVTRSAPLRIIPHVHDCAWRFCHTLYACAATAVPPRQLHMHTIPPHSSLAVPSRPHRMPIRCKGKTVSQPRTRLGDRCLRQQSAFTRASSRSRAILTKLRCVCVCVCVCVCAYTQHFSAVSAKMREKMSVCLSVCLPV